MTVTSLLPPDDYLSLDRLFGENKDEKQKVQYLDPILKSQNAFAVRLKKLPLKRYKVERYINARFANYIKSLSE